MGLFTKIVTDSAAELTKSIGETIDNLATSTEEKMAAKNQLTNIVLSKLNQVTEYQRDVLLSETTGTWLQRNWRPLLMLSFGVILIYHHFISQVFSLSTVDLPPEFWQLLNISVGGYVFGRTAEKIAGKVTENSDIAFLPKRKRDLQN